jgi:hypothetical protein
LRSDLDGTQSASLLWVFCWSGFLLPKSIVKDVFWVWVVLLETVLAPSSNTSTRKGKTSRVRAKQEHNSCMHAHSERFQCYVLFAELMIG